MLFTKGPVMNYKVIINWQNCYYHPTDSDTKRYEEMIKLKTRKRWKLYHRMFVGLWIHQISLQTDNSWFEETREIELWSKSNSANKIPWEIEKCKQCKYWQCKTNVCLRKFEKN